MKAQPGRVHLCLVVLLLAAPLATASATTVYQYAGNQFTLVTDSEPPAGTYTAGMSVVGSFTTSSPLSTTGLIDVSAAILSYSFSDGRQVLTQDNSAIFEFAVDTGFSGLPQDWRITISSGLTGGVEAGDLVGTITTFTTVDNVVFGLCASVDVSGNCLDINAAQADSALVSGNSGAWSVVPIPAAFWLFGSALGLLGWLKRRAV